MSCGYLLDESRQRFKHLSSRSHGLPSVVNLLNEDDYSFDRPDDKSTLSNFHRDDESVDGSSHTDEGNNRHDSFDVPATDDDDDDDDDQDEHEEVTLSSSNFYRGVQSEDGSYCPCPNGSVTVVCRGPVQPRYFTKGNPRNELYPETEVTDVHLESMSGTTCCICLDEYVRGQTRIILRCLHGFHSVSSTVQSPPPPSVTSTSSVASKIRGLENPLPVILLHV